MQPLPQATSTTGDWAADETKRPFADVEDADPPNAAMVAIAAAVGPDVVQSWRTDPAWPALEMRVVDLADDGLDPVATVRHAYLERDFDDAASAVQVMTWRIDNLVRDNRAPTASPREQHPEVADALAALQAMTASTPDEAVRLPLPNQLDERRLDKASTQRQPQRSETEPVDSNGDGIDEEVTALVRAAIAFAARMAEEIARDRERRARQAEAESERRRAEYQRRVDAERAAARPAAAGLA